MCVCAKSAVEKVLPAESRVQSDNVVETTTHSVDFDLVRLDCLTARQTAPRNKEASLQRAVWRNGGGKCGFKR